MSLMSFVLWNDNASAEAFPSVPVPFFDNWNADDAGRTKYINEGIFLGKRTFVFWTWPHPCCSMPEYIRKGLPTSVALQHPVEALVASLLAANNTVYRFDTLIYPFENDDNYISSFDFAEYWFECKHKDVEAMDWLNNCIIPFPEDMDVIHRISAPTDLEAYLRAFGLSFTKS